MCVYACTCMRNLKKRITHTFYTTISDNHFFNYCEPKPFSYLTYLPKLDFCVCKISMNFAPFGRNKDKVKFNIKTRLFFRCSLYPSKHRVLFLVFLILLGFQKILIFYGSTSLAYIAFTTSQSS
jgi:hypothetical protein